MIQDNVIHTIHFPLPLIYAVLPTMQLPKFMPAFAGETVLRVEYLKYFCILIDVLSLSKSEEAMELSSG